MYSDQDPISLPSSEAAERNKGPILRALMGLLPDRGHVLEIGSGTGQHVVYLAPAWPGLTWQPTERQPYLGGLNARVRLEGPTNVLPAIELDVTGAWPDRKFAAVFSSNTAHIMPWESVCAMFAGIAPRLVDRGVFCLYGPFNVGGAYTAASNQAFDRELRDRDPAMGLRDTGALASLAVETGMRLLECRQLPANNQLLVFRPRRPE